MRVTVCVAILVAGCASGQQQPAPVEVVVPRTERTEARAPEPAPTLAPTAPAPSATPAPSAAPPDTTERQPTADETRACAARGGTIQPVCMTGDLTCVIRYRDGGKRCSDKRDCTGECLYEGHDPPPPSATGICQRTSDPCGCKALIHHGRVEPTLCAD